MPILVYKSLRWEESPGKKAHLTNSYGMVPYIGNMCPDRRIGNTMWLARVESWNTRFPSQNWRALCLHRAFDIFFPGIGVVSIDTPFYSIDFPISRTVNRSKRSPFNSEIIFSLLGLTIFAIIALLLYLLDIWIVKIFSEKEKTRNVWN